MQASTVVTRTPAGNAELAEPAHGLSLTQRRFLTLLDTACSIEVLAARQSGEPDKLQRDLARLASLGLVAFDIPAANDEHVGHDSVRLGPPGASSRLPFLLVPLGVGLLGLVAWHWLSPAPAQAPVHHGSKPATVQPRADAAPGPAEAIATRVLVNETPVVRPREAAKEPAKVKAADAPAKVKPADNPPKVELADAQVKAPRPPTATPSALPTLQPIEARVEPPQPFVAAPIALPVERRSPAPGAATPPVARPTDSLTSKTDVHAPPLQMASAAPPAAALMQAPAHKLVPISQEPPAFPREAMAAGVAGGNVKARLVVDAKGNVSSVEIVEASHRAFDRAVRDALLRWRFEPGTAGRTTTVDVAFKRD